MANGESLRGSTTWIDTGKAVTCKPLLQPQKSTAWCKLQGEMAHGLTKITATKKSTPGFLRTMNAD